MVERKWLTKDEAPALAFEDPYGPPKEGVDVECLHCGERFSTDVMEWDGELWYCPKCHDGAGYGYDLHEVSAMQEESK